MKVNYAGRDYHFPAEALGGTRQAPLLKPADELLLKWYAEESKLADGPPAIYHDHYGVLTTVLHHAEPIFVSDSIVHHQRRADALQSNDLSVASSPVNLPYLAPAAAPTIVLMHLPKYLDLFEFYLHGLAQRVGKDFKLAAAFQTRHFTPRILEIAERYAATVTQSRAYKKARTLVLSDWRDAPKTELPLKEIAYRERTYRQHYGVFSSSHVDYATQFLLDTWRTDDQLRLMPAPGSILDIGTGNGVILDQLLRDFYPEANLYGTDISHVAVSSAKLNLPPSADIRWQSDLTGFATDSMDLIVTNPPFHEGHRNTIGPTLNLFREAQRTLAPAGYFVVVANRHLNYVTHLEKLFGDVREVATNDKFVVYRSSVPL
ncbi:class I SAM-dependent methyltransferase [Lewinella sp. 4G2]|uniref:class I SAM-dependent methyltransferase n=1 Tax=Lewinella sp. 4G2 TaxID=1803372 RepID=UPI0007B4B8D8|nr:methyltransferase [Lewinella sp. 4G2]OAV46098.1 hypothetical protein A3850_017710 [Lewinella sp. 4G2]